MPKLLAALWFASTLVAAVVMHLRGGGELVCSAAPVYFAVYAANMWGMGMVLLFQPSMTWADAGRVFAAAALFVLAIALQFDRSDTATGWLVVARWHHLATAHHPGWGTPIPPAPLAELGMLYNAALFVPCGLCWAYALRKRWLREGAAA